MRENRTSGSEGGAAQPNASSLPLSVGTKEFQAFITRDSIHLIHILKRLHFFVPRYKNIGIPSQCIGQNNGVQKDSHETSSNTSSSVKYLLAAAKGMIFLRRLPNRINFNCLVSASRAMSLRFFPNSSVAFFSMFSSCSSSRMVKVEVFMSYIM